MTGLLVMAAEASWLAPVMINAFLGSGMLPGRDAALQVAEIDEPWTEGVRTRIRPSLFRHVTSGASR